LIISTAKTKLEWYDVPMYPFISIISGVCFWYFYRLLRGFRAIDLKFNLLPYIFLFFIFITPYRTIIGKTYLPKEYNWEKDFYNISYYLKDVIKGKILPDNLIFLVEGYNPQIYFYLKRIEELKLKGFLWKDKSKLEVNDQVVCFQAEVKDYLNNHYDLEQLQNQNNILTFKINGRKPEN
jgi:hypothetical protein